MVTDWVIAGNSDVGVMVFTFVVSPGMLKRMRSASAALALACCMAALRVHWFPAVVASKSHTPSAVLASDSLVVRLTVKVLIAQAGPAASNPIKIAANTARRHKARALFSLAMDSAPAKVVLDISSLPLV